MRVLRLEVAEASLDLHPFVSIVRGTPADVRRRLLEVFAGLPAGRTEGATGLVYAHGVLLDLTPETLAVLELNQPVDVVVRSDDLPDPTMSGAARRRAELERARAFALGRLEQAKVDVARATRALRCTESPSRETGTNALAEARAERDALERERAEVSQRVAQARTAFDAAIDARNAAAREVERTGEARARAMLAVAEALPGFDESEPLPMRLVLAQVEAGGPPDRVPSEEAQGLVDLVAGIDAELADLGAPVQHGAGVVLDANDLADDTSDHLAIARQRLDAARTASGDEAEPSHARRRELDEAEAAWETALSQAETELTLADLRHRRRLLVERAVDLLGRDPGPDLEFALRYHRVLVPRTEPQRRLRSALHRAGIAVGDDDVPDDVVVTLARIWCAEVEQTPPPTAAEDAEVESEPTSSVESRKNELTHAFATERGAEKAEAEAWAALDAAAEAVRHTHAERTALERRLPAATKAAMTAGAEVSLLEARVAAAHRWAGAGEAELHNAVATARRDLDEAQAAMATYEAELRRAERELAELPRANGTSAPGPAVTSSSATEQMVWYLLSRLAQQRAVSYAGSVPLVLDGGLPDLAPEEVARVLGRLEQGAVVVQVVVLSDDESIAAWATALGADRAAVVEPALAPVARSG